VSAPHFLVAYAEFQEKEKGSIAAGKLADMVLLSNDVLNIDPLKIRDVRVPKTWVGGQLTYDGEGARP
jgi:predicted amidohydrolase YtcJ